jgi:hypothetical protein
MGRRNSSKLTDWSRSINAISLEYILADGLKPGCFNNRETFLFLTKKGDAVLRVAPKLTVHPLMSV